MQRNEGRVAKDHEALAVQSSPQLIPWDAQLSMLLGTIKVAAGGGGGVGTGTVTRTLLAHGISVHERTPPKPPAASVVAVIESHELQPLGVVVGAKVTMHVPDASSACDATMLREHSNQQSPGALQPLGARVLPTRVNVVPGCVEHGCPRLSSGAGGGVGGVSPLVTALAEKQPSVHAE